MSGNVGASMEFTARVGSILRELLPRCWITESGSQRLGGLFECLLQKAAVPVPTFYGATLSCVLEIVSRRLCIHIALEIGSWPRPVPSRDRVSARHDSYPSSAILPTFREKFSPGRYHLQLSCLFAEFYAFFATVRKLRFDEPYVRKVPLER